MAYCAPPDSDSVVLNAQSIQILTTMEELYIGERRCEFFGRNCYQSEPNSPTPEPFLRRRILDNAHYGILENCWLSVKIDTDRATSHQLVRHRHCSFAQESQRYCCYTKEKFEDKLQIVLPQMWYDSATTQETREQLVRHWEEAFHVYKSLLEGGAKPEDARCVLPNATKTSLCVSANIREWRHIMELRGARGAQPQVRALMLQLKKALAPWGYLFEDIMIDTHGINYVPQLPAIPYATDILINGFSK